MAICTSCDRLFDTKRALQQHFRDSPVHAVTFDCHECNRSFHTEEALQQHLGNSPAHAHTFDCDDCSRSFRSEEALQQHLGNSPVHTVTFGCEGCNRSFRTDDALQQHLRDSPAHTASLDCKDCDRSFNTEEALQQHLRDSPAHIVTFDCKECNRSFGIEEALQQHLRDSPAHTLSSPGVVMDHSFDIWPSLHKDVMHQLRPYNLSFDFFANDDSHGVLREHDTWIMGTFNCTNNKCKSKIWTSKQVAITIRRYPGQRYNARVYFQRCESCNSISEPELDSSYAERVSYRLAKWSGVAVEEPPYSGHSKGPHQSSLCEGCRFGHCRQSRL